MSDVRRGLLPATLADVAERAGVSRQTVSNALNNPALLRADTLLRVRVAVAELGYTPNRAARNLRTRASRTVGVRVAPVREGTANVTPDRFVHTLVDAFGESGYQVLLFASDGLDPLAGYEDLMAATAVDAFVATDTFLGNPQTTWLQANGVPFVAFGRPWDAPDATHPWVDVDGSAGTRSATEHLLGRGLTRIAWLGWPAGSAIGGDRRAGWAGALAARGLAGDLVGVADDHIATATAEAGRLLDETRPEAVVCASDTLALGVLRALDQRGLRAGRDVAVTGFDDSPSASLVTPALTSVREPLEQVARAIVTRLHGRLSPPYDAGSDLLLAPALVVRDSSLTSAGSTG